MTLALLALFVALALFWLSTRQWRTPARLAIWGAGVGLLGFAALFGADKDRVGLGSALAELLQSGPHWADSGLARALSLNLGMIAPFIRQLMDFFVLAGAVTALLSLLAFTKGERLERFLRPCIAGLIGFIIGSAATLGIVAVGFGGYVKPRAFSGIVSAESVQDGDSFRLGEYSLRLYGADAPEMGQTCLGPTDESLTAAPFDCGAVARDQLVALLSTNPILCTQMLSRSGRPRDSFGRALVRCTVQTQSGELADIAEMLIRGGYAVQYEGKDFGYRAAEVAAERDRAGLMASCALRPDVWRNDDGARILFYNRNFVLAGFPTMGDCTTARSPS